jgi:membrane-bound serine protease (ClpP class)
MRAAPERPCMRVLLLLVMSCMTMCAAQAAAPVLVLSQNSAIGPASVDYLQRGMAKAADLHAQLVIIRMDTPGGLDLSMRAIIRDILASQIPVAVYVAPDGARAASAGTYILFASHIAAMAPATNLGAATPIMIGGDTPDAGEPEAPSAKGERKAERPAVSITSSRQTLLRKQTNDAAAYIRGLAQMRGRNADWAEQAVRDAVSIPAQEALKLKVIDLIAADVPQLLKQIDGRKLIAGGREVHLATSNAEIVEYNPDWRTRLLMIITDPGIAYILLLVGIYGLLFEFLSPGFVAPGVIGAISLLLGLLALQMLPVSFAGLALMALGVALLVAEHYAPGFGILGGGGLVAFAAGSMMLIDTETPGYGVPLSVVAAATAAIGALLLVTLTLALRSRRLPVVSGREHLMGAGGEIIDQAGGAYYARVFGERWQVRSAAPLAIGVRIRVIAIEGLVLVVEPLQTEGAMA